MFLLLFYYTLFGYKKPHGNLLKYLMIIYAMSLLSELYMAVKFNEYLNVCILSLSMLFIGYISGRLHKINENCFLAILILILQLLIPVFVLLNGTSKPSLLMWIVIATPAVIWLSLTCACLVRFEQHREAGLKDEKEI